MSTSIKISNCDTLKIHKRTKSKYWQVSFYIGRSNKTPSGMFRCSLKTVNQKEAEKLAKQMWKDTPRVEIQERTVQLNYHCSDIFPKYLNFAKRSKKEMNMYKNYIDPIMGNIDVRKTDELINAIEEVKLSCLERELKGKTIKKYINIVSLGLGYAQERSLISKRPKMPSIDISDSEDRPAFEQKEIKIIAERFKLEKDINDETFYFEMSDLINFMRSVPVRPGKEPLNIKNKDCTSLNHIKFPDEKVLHIRLRDTKTAKHHELTVSPEFYNQIYTQSMTTRYPHSKPDDYLFYPNHLDRDKLYERIRKNFKRVCELLGLYYNDLKQPRTMYSIRHSFFEQRHKMGASMDSLSVMGNTSNEMLRKHYIKQKTFDLHDEVYGSYYKKKYGV